MRSRLAGLALFAGNLAAIWPYLLSGFSSQPWNNDYIYIAEARVFRDFPWSWNPLQYAGVPFAYVYPPVFHILTLAIPVSSLGYAYHLASGLAYALVPVALYVLALQLFGSRLVAGLAAVAYSILPSLLCFLAPTWIPPAEGWRRAPWGFTTLIAYGEAPHTLALALILFAVAAAWRDRWLIASLLGALVFLTSWPGAMGLLIALAALGVARSHDLGAVAALKRVAGTAGVAYGLSAFWITPGFFASIERLSRVILRHDTPWAPWSASTWAIVASGVALAALCFHRRVPANAAFVLTLVLIPGAALLAFALTGSNVLPVPHRYILELNAGLVLAVGWCVWAARRWRVPALIALAAVGLVAGVPFLRRVWQLQDRGIDPRTTVAFQIADWLARNAGSSRVFTAGELDGSLNLWSNVPQVGGSHNGISNFLVVAAQKEVSQGDSARASELWLRALDVRYVVVHDAASREHFHWFTEPEKFAALPVAWSNGAGDRIYRLAGDSAVVVDLAAMEKLPPLASTHDLRFLEAYEAWARGTRPASVRWNRADSADVEANLNPGEAVLIKTNYDAGWRVSSGSAGRDPIGFLLLRVPRGPVRLRYGAAWDVWLGRAITLLTIALLLLHIPAHWIAALAVVPAAAAFAMLSAGEPRVAEDTFRTLHPPLISPGGIVDGATYAQPPLKRGHPISIWGRDFGGPHDSVRVLIGDREARILSRQPSVLAAELPPDAPPAADVQVEVNGRRGNAFRIATEKGTDAFTRGQR